MCPDHLRYLFAILAWPAWPTLDTSFHSQENLKFSVWPGLAWLLYDFGKQTDQKKIKIKRTKSNLKSWKSTWPGMVLR